MKVNLLFNSVLLCSLTVYVNSDFPSDIEKCKYSDNVCHINVINQIFRTKSKGDRGLNLVSLEPLKINSIDIKQGAESPVNIDLKFRNCSLIGLKGSQIYKVKGFGLDLKGPHEVRGKTTFITLLGDYSINGRVLILPITGNGKSNITLKNIDMVLRFEGKPFMKDDKTYLKIGKMFLDIKTTRVYTNFENLFNGDQTLSNTMNAFLNDNWKDIWDELKDSVLKAFKLIFKSVIGNTFDKYPYNELYLE